MAEVIDLDYSGKEPKVENVIAAVDCGVVVNPDSARNMGEGGIIDGIGNAFYGSLSFENGVPSSNNFDGYRMIRLREAPKHIDIHFVETTKILPDWENLYSLPFLQPFPMPCMKLLENGRMINPCYPTNRFWGKERCLG